LRATSGDDTAIELTGWAPHFAALYEALTGDFRGDVPMYLEMGKRHEGPILELACGTGRVAIPLVEAGHAVVGIDFDAGMIKLAESKAKLLGLHRNISFIEADIVDFDLGRKFPLIVAGGNSLIHLLDFKVVLKSIERCRDHLEDDGSLYVAFETSPYLAAAANSELSASAHARYSIAQRAKRCFIGEPPQSTRTFSGLHGIMNLQVLARRMIPPKRRFLIHHATHFPGRIGTHARYQRLEGSRSIWRLRSAAHHSAK
jgi:SAM-dependent methyltransferase